MTDSLVTRATGLLYLSAAAVHAVGVDLVAEFVPVVVLALLVSAVVRRAVLASFRTARRAGMASTSPDRRRPA